MAASLFSRPPVASLFSQPPIAYFQPLESPPNACAPSFVSCEAPGPGACCFGDSGLTEFETISSKVCGWAGELGKDHDLRQRTDHCAWLFSEQAAPFHVGAELPSSALIPTAQRQPRVDFLSSAAAMKSIFRAACDVESDVGVLVHRLGDWLVIDDGSEISCLGHGASAARSGDDSTGEELRRRAADQWHCAATARVEAAQSRVAETQQRVEAARSALWQAEVEAHQAQEALREAVGEARRAAEERDRLRGGSHIGRAADESVGGCLSGTARGNTEHEGSRIQSLDVEVDAPEELQLYRNFLGHSIQLLTDGEQSQQSSSGGGGAPASGELVALDGPPTTFRQVGVWKIAGDASVVIGSRMLCLGNKEHPKLTLYLHNGTVLSDMQLLEHWVECLIAGVPEFAICFHRDGAVQSYTLYKVSELRHFLEERLAIGRKLQMTLEVLRWIKRQCSFEGCTYWLSKAKSEPKLKLFKLSGMPARSDAANPAEEARVPVPMHPEFTEKLVLKNTFLHVADAEEAATVEALESFRRSQSCPARFCGVQVGPEEPWPQGGRPEPSLLSEPLRQRVSALFFRRAVSSPPGPDASRFFQHALDLEASDCGAAGTRPPSGRAILQSCCHLGLAFCDHVPIGRRAGGAAAAAAAAGGEGCAGEDASRALLKAIRGDLQCHSMTGSQVARYRLLPLRGYVRRAELLFLCAPPWPQGLLCGGSASKGRPNRGVSDAGLQAARALDRVGDGLALLSEAEAEGAQHGLPDCDHARVEAIAFPTATLILLHLASHLKSKSMCRSGSDATGLAQRALAAARQFVALDAAQRRPELQPLFIQLPTSEELLVRVEQMSGWHHLAAALEQQGHEAEPPPLASGGADARMSELESKLARLEEWLIGQELRVAEAEAALAERLGGAQGPAAPGQPPALQAVWHFERSIRWLPKALQRGGQLIHQMMLVLTIALIEAASSLLQGFSSAELSSRCCHGPFNTLGDADLLLGRAEGVATAAGHQAMGAIVQASRGHLRGLAADALVVRCRAAGGGGQQEGGLGEAEVSALRALCMRGESDSDDADEDFDEDGDLPSALGRFVGRLGDQAMNLALEAQQSLDAVIEPEAASVLAVMSSGALQGAASRLRALPPPGVQETECRRAVLSMLTRAIELLKQATHHPPGASSSGTGRFHASALFAPRLCAHAHLMQCEVHADPQGHSGAQQRQQRLAWNLDRALTALHGSTDGSAAATLLLVHVHVLRAQLVSEGAIGCKRQGEQALEELVSACRAMLLCTAAAAEIETSPPLGPTALTGPQADTPERMGAAWTEACGLLLQRLRAVLRDLCAREGAARGADGVAGATSWKSLYRATLQLEPQTVTSVVHRYDAAMRERAS